MSTIKSYSYNNYYYRSRLWSYFLILLVQMHWQAHEKLAPYVHKVSEVSLPSLGYFVLSFFPLTRHNNFQYDGR